MESTKLPMRVWFEAFHEIGGAKKGVSSRQLARKFGITLKSAWHLSHRIRATMKDDRQFFSGGIVESDETYIGGKRRGRGRGYKGNKMAVQVIVERKHGGKRGQRQGECENECPGRAQTIALDQEADKVDGRTVGAKLRAHTDPEKTRLMTDESPIYNKTGEAFKSHETVNHAKKEYARTEPHSGRLVSTNAAEGLFANLKRQITGTHHSTSKKHLPRYLEEYDHKYNNRAKSDTEITEAAVKNIEGRRVTLFKSKSGGDSLIDTGPGVRRKHGTMRGMHTKRKAHRFKGRPRSAGHGRAYGKSGGGAGRGRGLGGSRKGRHKTKKPTRKPENEK
jgi:hypothetical protein